MTLLIDADMLCFAACCASETDYKFNEYQHVLVSDERDALDYVAMKLEEYQSITGDRGKLTMCFTDNPTFRQQEVYQEYKANRIGKRKPLALKNVIEATKRYYDFAVYPHLEADDVMSLIATAETHPTCVIVSGDKDMKSVPCILLRNGELETISKKRADRNWMISVLTGDRIDNIQGLPGVGPKTAEKILGDSDTLSDMWDKVVTAYEKKKLSYTSALQSARLTRILRHGEYNKATHKVTLWEPPTT
jgi:DNA polymerase-1